MMIRILKILVSLTLISILLWTVEWRDIALRLRELDPALAALSFILLTIQYPISAWKWRTSLRLHGVEYRYTPLLRIMCIGFFFNNFLPTAIGGDAYRAYRTFGHAARPAHAISAVILERLLGILSLLFLGYLCAIYLVVFGDLAHRDLVVAGLLVASAGIGVSIAGWYMDMPFARRFLRKLSHTGRFEPFFDSLRTIRKNRRYLPKLIAQSLLFQAVAIWTVSLLFASIGIPGELAESGFTAAAAGVAGVLPVSINGVGVVEGSFVIAAVESGLPYSESVLVAICLRGYMLFSSVVFGVLYALEPKESRPLSRDGVS